MQMTTTSSLCLTFPTYTVSYKLCEKQLNMDHFVVKGQKRKEPDASKSDCKRAAMSEGPVNCDGNEDDDDAQQHPTSVTLSYSPLTPPCHANQPGLIQEVTYHNICRLYSF